MNLTVGKVYAVFSEAGASATLHNGAVLEFPAGQPVTLVAQQATLELDGHAVVREIPNGNAVLLGEMMAKAQKWVQDLRAELAAMLDGTQFEVFWQASQNKLIVHTDRADDTQLEAVTGLLERVLPQNIEVVHTNYILPAGYKEVEYIQTQKFTGLATDFLPSNETEVEVDVIRVSNVYYGRLCGNFGGGNQQDMFAVHHVDNISFDFGNSRSDFSAPSETDIGKRYTAKYGQSGIFINGVQLGEVHVAAPFKATMPMYIFTVLESPITAAGEYQTFRFKVYDVGKLVFDFIPTLDEVGAPCFFDVVSCTPYYNIGILDFIVPGVEQAAAAIMTLDLDAKSYAQLTEHGVRRLYHVPEGYNGTKEEYAMEHGFKPLVETPQPEEGYWAPQWRETEEEIVLEWVETEPPAEEELSS